MAITRAQQARQMYKKGSEPVEQAGVMNYMPSEMVTVPKVAKSSPDTPAAKLAYITPEEQDILVNLNLYGSLDGKPNRGPGGLPSLEGDFGSPSGQAGTGPGSGGTYGGAEGPDVSGTTDKGTGDYQVTDKKVQQEYNKNRAIREYNRRQVENIGKKKNPISNFFSNLPTPFNLVRKFVNQFGPLNNRDFYNEKVVPAGLNTFKNYEDYMSQRMAGKVDAYGREIDQNNNGDGPEELIIPLRDTSGIMNVAEKPEEEVFTPNLRLLAEGGMADLDREAFLVGGIAKAVKKAVRTVKKIAKSPVGKAALLYTVGFGIPGTSFGGLLGTSSGSLFGARQGIFGTFGPTSALKKLGILKTQIEPGLFERVGPLSKLGPLAGIGGLSALAGLYTAKTEDDEEEPLYAGADIDDPRKIMANPYNYLNIRNMAEGGSTEKEPVAKKTMPLLDMGGMEKDYREEGGFVPIGRMEKADDVPARLSKNEFVFTADAVRNAGDGDVDKGAEVMYNMMKNLESGGDVSEESQGLEGAREMFQTSKRLEEVL